LIGKKKEREIYLSGEIKDIRVKFEYLRLRDIEDKRQRIIL